jgi:ferredoxin
MMISYELVGTNIWLRELGSLNSPKQGQIEREVPADKWVHVGPPTLEKRLCLLCVVVCPNRASRTLRIKNRKYPPIL